MKRCVLLTMVILGFAANSFAQTNGGDKISFGLETAIPDFANSNGSGTSSIAIGGSIKYDKYIKGDFYLTGSAQYLYYPYNSFGRSFDELLAHEHGPWVPVDPEFTHSGDNFVTLMIGGKYYLTNKFYSEAQVGIEAVAGTFHGNPGSFVFSPGVGYDFGGGFDAGLRYQGWIEGNVLSSLATLRIAYSFKIKDYKK